MPTFDNSFARLDNSLFTRISPSGMDNARWVIRNESLAGSLGIDLFGDQSNTYLQAFSGNATLEGSEPLAMVYAGHQFGHYVPQLGDGRGLLLGEVLNDEGHWDLHLKGAGQTPYSRQGDGRAVLRSSIREYLCSEALYHLGIPTTRALSISTGDLSVWRETQEPAAMLVRVAQSHVRFGSFEYFHYNRQPQLVKLLADYCIDRHFPAAAAEQGERRYQLFLEAVVQKTAIMIAHWQASGFAHGVMNTDNMSIIGDTLDFGPFGFLDDYNEMFICNHSDHSGRYAFNRQPGIALWNLNALAHGLSSLLDDSAIKASLQKYEPLLIEKYTRMMRDKLGLQLEQDSDAVLLQQLLQMMQDSAVDYSNTFRTLGTVETGETKHRLRDNFIDREKFDQWMASYQKRLGDEERDDAQRHQAMNRCNPKFILRNYLAQQAIEKAETGDYSELERLAEVLRQPFDEQPDREHYANTPPDWGKRLSISCSS